MSVSFRKTTVFLAEIGQGDRKTYLECMAEGEAEDLVGKKKTLSAFALPSSTCLCTSIYMLP